MINQKVQFRQYQISRSTLFRIILWLIVCLIFSLWALIPTWDNWAGALGAMHGAIGMVANLFIIGLPFSLGVALMFTTDSVHRKFAQTPLTSKKVIIAISVRYFFLILILSAYVTLAEIAAFSRKAIEYSHVDPIDIYKYFPGVVLSGIIISIILTSLLLPIILAVDDWRYSTLLGSGFLYGLGTTFGNSTLYVHDLSLFSLFHLYRFLALALSGNVVCPTMGQIWGNPDMMHMIMGLYVEWEGLLGPLIIYGLLSIISFFLSILIFKNHHNLWVYELHSTEDWVIPNKRTDMPEIDNLDAVDKKIHKNLRRQRQIVAIIIGVLIIGGPLVIFGYERQRESELTYVLYENSGQIILLGQFYFGEVDVPVPPVGMNNMYQLETEILDWGSCPEPLERWSGFREMSLEEFESLNVTERESLVSTGHLSITQDDTSTGGGWWGFSSINDFGTFVWFFKYNSTEMPTGSLTVSIKVSVQSK